METSKTVTRFPSTVLDISSSKKSISIFNNAQHNKNLYHLKEIQLETVNWTRKMMIVTLKNVLTSATVILKYFGYKGISLMWAAMLTRTDP